MESIMTPQFSYATTSYFPVPFHLQNAYQTASSNQQKYASQIPMPPDATVYPTAVYPLPQYQQGHQLFQKDAQIITPEALASVKAALASSDFQQQAETKKKAVPRKAAGQTWEDPTLSDWPENDFRLFCGDLGNEVNDDVLSKAFSRFPSFNKARYTG